jgi:hypothetical protein
MPTRTARPGLDRGATAYAWPSTLLRPRSDTTIVYLDLNHWIGLAKASVGHPDGGRYEQLLGVIRRLPPRFAFPLSSVHFMEVSGNRNAGQRREVAATMEEISGFRSLTSMLTITELECDAALAEIAGTTSGLPSVELLGQGVLHAFGRRGGLRVRTADRDITPEARRMWRGGPAFFDAFSRADDTVLSRTVLRGPDEADVPKLVGMGWDPRAAKRVADERAQRQREMSERLTADDRLRRGKTRDLLSAWYLTIEMFETFTRVAARHHAGIEAVIGDRDVARRLTDSMPSADVHISLLTAAQRNPQTRWNANSILDIDAMSVAAAYCDVVLTEQHFGNQLRATKLAERLGTKVFVTPEGFADFLAT